MLSSTLPLWLPPVLAAPFIGSFLGVVVRRLPAGRPVAWARSCCDDCQHALRGLELVPIGSFLWQRGRCRHCGGRIAPAHLWIELAALGVAISAAVVADAPAPLWADCGLGWMLLALGWIDWTHFRLPDVLTLPLLLAGLAATVTFEPDAATDHAAAAVLGYAAFRIVALTYKVLRKRDGLGGGDAKLLAAIGAWVGVGGLGPTVLVAALVGLAVGALRGGKLTAQSIIPFGPCLAIAAWLVRLVQ